MVNIIYHIADIHVTNNEERIDEYEKAFENLYKILEKDTEEKLIVVCGDTFHEKNLHNNTQEVLVKDFINNLSKYGEIVIIDGNHDVNLNNENAISSVESLLTHLKHDNKIHHLQKNEIVKIKGINFGLTTMINKGVTPIVNKNPNEVYIGLYHGSLYGSVTDLNCKDENNKSLTNNDFKDYDIVMLGDIHKFQYMNSKKTIAYSSSLIQQNFGENIQNHGVIRWDITTKKGEFIEVPNEYVYKKLTVIDPLKYEIDDIINKKVRLTLYYKNMKNEQLETYIDNIKKHCTIIKLSCQEIIEDIEIINNDKTIGNNIMTIYKEYLKENKIEEDIQVTEVLKSYVEEYKEGEIVAIKNIKLLELEFENLCTYGSNNKINFRNIKGLNLLCGKNGLGKTSIIDIILFSIYKKFSTGSSNEILNRNFNEGYSIITVELNGAVYKIKRNINIFNKSNRRKLEIYKNNIDVTCSTKKITEDYIVKTFGSYEDMLMTSTILQVGENFVEKKDKHSVITKQLGFETYDIIFEKIKKEYNRLKSVASAKKLTNIDYQKIINENIEEEKKEQHEFKKVNEQIQEHSNEIFLINSKLDNDIKNNNVENLKKRQTKIKSEIEKNNNKLNNYEFYNYDLNLELEKNNIITENELINDKIQSIYKNIINIEQIKLDFNFIKKLKDTVTKITENIKNKEDENTQIKTELQLDINIIVDYDYINKIQKNIDEQQKIINEIVNTNKILVLLRENNQNLLKHQFSLRCKNCKHNKIIHEEMGYLKEIEMYENKLLELNESKDDSDYKSTIIKLTQIIKNNEQLNKYMLELNKINSQIDLENEKITKNKINEKNKLLNEKYEVKINDEKNKYNENKNKYKRIQECIEIIKNINLLNKEFNKNELLISKLNKYQEELIRVNIIEDQNKELLKQSKIINERIDKCKNKLCMAIHEKEKEDKLKKEIDSQKHRYKLLNKICSLYYDSKVEYKDIADEPKLKIKKKLEKYKQLNNNHIGIKTYMINKKLKILETRLNNLLNDITTFQIAILIENSEIDFYKILNKDTEKYLNIKRLSGYERTCFNIAIRVALNSMNVIMKNNFLIIDEGFGTCDDKNIFNIINLIDVIKKDYETVIIISHLNEIKNIKGNKITIMQNNTTKISNISIL